MKKVIKNDLLWKKWQIQLKIDHPEARLIWIVWKRSNLSEPILRHNADKDLFATNLNKTTLVWNWEK